MAAEADLAELFGRIVRMQVDLFGAVDARLCDELDLLLPLRVVAAICGAPR